MTEITPEQKYYRTRRREVYFRWAFVASLVVIAWLFLKRGCGEAKESKLAYVAIEKRLKSVIGDSARLEAEVRGLKNAKEDMDLRTADYIADLLLTKDALFESEGSRSRLAAEVKKAKASKDTASYIAHCDSLAEESEKKDGFLQKAWAQARAIDSARKEQIKNVEKQRDVYKQGYESCLSAVVFSVAELPKIKPRGKLCAVVSGIGSGPLLGIGGGFTYVTKTKVLIGAKAYATNQGLLTTLEFGVPLNFKRK